MSSQFELLFLGNTIYGKLWSTRILVVVEIKEYEILYDTGEARKLVTQINRMAKEGWQAKSIGTLAAPTGVRAVYVLMEREVS